MLGYPGNPSLPELHPLHPANLLINYKTAMHYQIRRRNVYGKEMIHCGESTPIDTESGLATRHSWCLQSLCASAGDPMQDMSNLDVRATLKQGIRNSACMAENIDLTNILLEDPLYAQCLPDAD